ncbi:hypothetical protein AVEN_27124-1 [Araneus ventricosus]|uniref:Uncharacterized protein n=1 Tax=Araneus ventricosus TaxID=182803 RepID=A0A4Y2VH69_ARAVE|nr:hypothetical protein AVEN_27124-1 [Araneus ventricosus]
MTLLGRILCFSTALVVAFLGTLLFKSAFVTGLSECTEYEFPCDNNGECIDAGLWCDTNEDCSDGSDEKYCKRSSLFNKDPNKCPSTYFRCRDGPCIPMVGRCDGYDTCQDSSDEMNCMYSIFSSKGWKILY